MTRLYLKEKNIESRLENISRIKVHYFDTVTSTNDIAKKLLLTGDRNMVVISDEQTSGKGRLGRSWQSTKNTGVYMTICKKIDITKNASVLSIGGGIAVCKALNALGIQNVSIKWPNDVLINKKKVCGVLSELVRINGYYYAFIGIGVNVLNDFFEGELSSKATSLYLEGYRLSTEQVSIEIVKSFEKVYNNIVVGNFSLKKYESFLNENVININKKVVVSYENSEIEALAIKVNEDGTLKILFKGRKVDIHSGEVTLKGFY